MRRWYVVHTQPNGETRAALNLQRQEFEVYLPRHLVRRRHARRVERVIRPLFPRYLFVRFDPTRDRWRSINGTFGVSHLIAHEQTPLAVPDGIVEDILAHENGVGLIDLEPPLYQPGQRLEVIHGPMAPQTGLFLSMPDKDRVVMLLDLLGRQVRVTMPRDAVAAA